MKGNRRATQAEIINMATAGSAECCMAQFANYYGVRCLAEVDRACVVAQFGRTASETDVDTAPLQPSVRPDFGV